jgi:hypothetical protein
MAGESRRPIRDAHTALLPSEAETSGIPKFLPAQSGKDRVPGEGCERSHPSSWPEPALPPRQPARSGTHQKLRGKRVSAKCFCLTPFGWLLDDYLAKQCVDGKHVHLTALHLGQQCGRFLPNPRGAPERWTPCVCSIPPHTRRSGVRFALRFSVQSTALPPMRLMAYLPG